ncbi:MAG: TrbC/VirB2 family protein [Candidatus Pacebacteria bacterium]|nr:TrbC/VirB2 family protein [Candidatus Paceibacterota bacterium]
MRKVLQVLYVCAGLALLLIPVAAYAQGLVPCTGAMTCDICDLGKLMQNIINFMLVGIAVPLAALMFAYAGVLYFTGGSDPHRIARARKIFKNVLTGLLIALSAWLVVNTIMTVVFSKDFFTDSKWFELQCVSNTTATPGRPGRLINTTFDDLIGVILPEVDPPEYTRPPTPVVVGTNSNGVPISCPSGATYDQKNHTCVGSAGEVTQPVPVPAITPGPFPPPVTPSGPISAGSCAPNPGAFGANANLMSCICGAESGGIASRPSGSDIMYNDPGRRAFSWGLYQINISVNQMMCPGQPTLNCPAAFSGKNYSARVINETLYAACVAAAKNPSCNTASAAYLLNHTPNGAKNWSTYGKCVGR